MSAIILCYASTGLPFYGKILVWWVYLLGLHLFVVTMSRHLENVDVWTHVRSKPAPLVSPNGVSKVSHVEELLAFGPKPPGSGHMSTELVLSEFWTVLCVMNLKLQWRVWLLYIPALSLFLVRQTVLARAVHRSLMASGPNCSTRSAQHRVLL